MTTEGQKIYSPKTPWQLYEAVIRVDRNLKMSSRDTIRIIKQELQLEVDEDMIELTKEWRSECRR